MIRSHDGGDEGFARRRLGRGDDPLLRETWVGRELDPGREIGDLDDHPDGGLGGSAPSSTPIAGTADSSPASSTSSPSGSTV